jgi:(2Fe-2S) ferredoxin
LWFVVWYLFKTAAETTRILEELKLKDHPVERLAMGKANKVLEEFIEREGNVECEKLAKMHVLPRGPWDEQKQ